MDGNRTRKKVRNVDWLDLDGITSYNFWKMDRPF